MSKDSTFDHPGNRISDQGEDSKPLPTRGLDGAGTRHFGRPSKGASATDLDLQAVFDVLDDGDCRAFLEVLDEPLTAAELSKRCGVPSSTTYRKLDRLTAVGLVDSTLEICGTNNHQARYHRTIKSFTFEFDGERLSIEAEPGEP